MADLYLYGEIGYEVTASWVADQLKDTTGDLNVYMHSPGGSLYEAMAIHGLLTSYNKNRGAVRGYIHGVVASAMAYVTTAIPKGSLYMDSQAWMMVHMAAGGEFGTPEELRKRAELIEKQAETMVTAFAERTGKDKEQIRNMLSEDHWMDAETSVSEGFVDTVIEAEQSIAAKISSDMLEKFGYNRKKVPQQITTTAKSNPMEELIKILNANGAGLQANATNDSVRKAVQAVVSERDNLKAQLDTKTETVNSLNEKVDNLEGELSAKKKDLESANEKLAQTQRKELVDEILNEAGVRLTDEQNKALDRRVSMYFETENEEYRKDIKADMVTFAKASGVPVGQDPDLTGKGEREDPTADEDSIAGYEKKLDAKVRELMAEGKEWDEAIAMAKQLVTA